MHPTPPEVSPAEAAGLVDAGALLLDVREPDEWAAGHAPPAVHLPLGRLREAAAGLPTDRPIVCVCHVGGRSAAAAAALRGAGWDARNLAGGMAAWARDGFPVVDGTGRPGTVI